MTLHVGSKPGYLDEVLSHRGSRDLRPAENNPFNVYTALFGLSSIDPAPGGAARGTSSGLRRE